MNKNIFQSHMDGENREVALLRKETFQFGLVHRKLGRNCFNLIIPDKVTRDEKVSIFLRQTFISINFEVSLQTQAHRNGPKRNAYENWRLGFVVQSSVWILVSSFFILSPKTFT